MDDKEAARRRRMAALERAALVVLIDRAGGSVSYTQGEYDAVGAKHGGMRNLVIRELVEKGEGAPVVRLTLARRAPANADLPS
jgi:hypothetical protein